MTNRDANGLTPRQHEIVQLVAAGLTNREIADRLYISEATTKNHIYTAAIRLGIPERGNCRVQLARWVWDGEKTAPERREDVA